MVERRERRGSAATGLSPKVAKRCVTTLGLLAFWSAPERASAAMPDVDKGGSAMTERLCYTEFRAPFGCVFVAATHRGICRISLGNVSREEFVGQLRDELGQEPVEDRVHLKGLLEDLKRCFSGEVVELDYPMDLSGATDFQRKVWSETKKIPRGETRTYREIAEAIGSPNAYRAVGQALGANPIPVMIPCHRVIGSDGGLVGFGPGLKMKDWLLCLEGVR